MIITFSPPFCPVPVAQQVCLFDRIPPAANRCSRLALSVMIEVSGGEKVNFGNFT